MNQDNTKPKYEVKVVGSYTFSSNNKDRDETHPVTIDLMEQETLNLFINQFLEKYCSKEESFMWNIKFEPTTSRNWKFEQMVITKTN